MNRTEHTAQMPSPQTGSLAVLRAPLRRGGSGALRFALLLTVGFLLVLLVTAAPALACEEPAFSGGVKTSHDTGTALGPFTIEVHTADIETAGIETKWRIEWAKSQSELEKGLGKEVPGGSGTIPAGTKEATVETTGELTGLTPETAYWFRAVAENKCGNGREVNSIETKRLRPVASETQITNVTATSAHLHASVNPENFETHWRLEYATSETGTWKLAGKGVIPQAQADEQFHQAEADVSGLSLGTTYYVRLVAESEREGQHVEVTGPTGHFQTSGPPSVTAFATYALHGEALRVLGSVTPNNSGLNEVQTVTIGGSPSGGTFTLTSSKQTATATGVGNITAGSNVIREVKVTSGEFVPSVENVPITGAGIPAGTTIERAEGDHETWTITLSQPASVSGTAVAVTAGLLKLPFNASFSAVRSALSLLAGVEAEVAGPDGGPYTVEFVGASASSNRPQLEADAASLTPSGTVTVATVHDGFAYETRYHFEYVTQKSFDASGWSAAVALPDQKIEDTSTHLVGQDLSGLQPGAYRYRLVASNSTPGNPVVHSAEQTLTVALPAEPGPPEGCPNERFRAGLSAHLPDCRAYEQISPVDKGGAQEALKYVGGFSTGALVGEDGEHFMYMSLKTRWGSAPTDGQAPYLFSRTGQGWQMTAGTPQPQAGFDTYMPRVFSRDLTQFGVEAGWVTEALEAGRGRDRSPNVEFMAGPVGGPYVTVASVPRVQPGTTNGEWVGASEDFSKLILELSDHTLLGKPTATLSGSDLYEYSGGGLRQANVDSSGNTIGACGANIVKGDAETIGNTEVSTRHAVSADGSRVFFEAAPSGTGCEGKHLYVRVDGGGEHAETLDLGGAYRFLAANAQGSEVLLEKASGETHEVLLYDARSASVKPLFSEQEQPNLTVSRDFSTIYLKSRERLAGTEAPPIEGHAAETKNLYRYDISSGTLRFLLQATFRGENGSIELSPDGRYYYFTGRGVGGLGGGGKKLHEDGSEGPERSLQLYRYDGAQNVVECVSCASPSDPEPRLGVDDTGGSQGTSWARRGMPEESFVSADGGYAFFVTSAALVPGDVNGEVPPEEGITHAKRLANSTPSNDVYEWRRVGLGGCTHVQGCLSLITSGTDGFLVALIGTAAEGRDVFFYTSSQLLPRDNDAAGDFYDARIGGGFPEAVKPVECEGDACLSPLTAPIDATPSSLSFSGPGNPTPPRAVAKPTVRPRGKHCKRGRCKQRMRKQGRARRAVRRAGGHNRGGPR